MATVTYFSRSDVDPTFSVRNLGIETLLGWEDYEYHIETLSPTSVRYSLANGFHVKLVGTGFTASGGQLGDTGTITSLQILGTDGTTVLRTVSLSLATQVFNDALSYYDMYRLGEWLLSGNDTMNGSAAGDSLIGYGGADRISGGAGDDYIDGGAGRDVFNGGTGFDVLSFQMTYGDINARHGIVLNAASGTVTDPYGNAETFTGFESFRGTPFGDVMTGSSINEVFMGWGAATASTAAAGSTRYNSIATPITAGPPA